MRLKSIGVLRGYAMGKTQLSKIADNIEREVEEALEFERSENARLRSELESVGTAAYLYGRGDLKAENAKLRELLAVAWGYINHPANATWTHKKRKEVRDSIGDRIRELGVEVDG